MTERASTDPLPTAGVSRRRFVQGLAATGSLVAAGATLRPGMARAAPGLPPALSGSSFDLEIDRMRVNFTGQAATAHGVNGSVPGPILRWRQGDTVMLNVTNRLSEPTSIHWHGIRAPWHMDGVPGLSFRGIAPGQTFTYRIPLLQSGTYWYHSHSMFQEQTGLYGALIVEPKAGYAQTFDRDYVVMLSDWTDENPETVVSNLKGQSDYYNRSQRTVGSFFADAGKNGVGAAVADRLEWGRMRMSPTDIADVTGATYTYLLNGTPPSANWTGLFRPGERVRLRLINGSSMTFFDVRLPGLTMSVLEADGNSVVPVAVDELRLGPAETYDVIVQPTENRAYTLFAQSEDRSGYARGTLAPRPGMQGAIPPMDPRPMRTMADMGMDHGAMPGMDHGSMPGMDMPHVETSDPVAQRMQGAIGVDNVALMPAARLHEAGDGLDGNGRRVLTYADLRATVRGDDPRPPTREITLHLTGNMMRYMWGFDGKKFSEAEPIRLKKDERVRFVLINDTMMEHPIHLHGLWSELENGHGEFRPYKHTVIVKPGEKLSYLVTADEAGHWAYHCHLLYHMEMGMFRTVIVA